MASNNNSNKNSYDITQSHNMVGFGFFTIILLAIGGLVFGVMIFDRDVPNEDRDSFLGYTGGILVLIGSLYLVHKLSGRTVNIVGQEIDSGMIAYVVIILMIIFLAN